MGPEWGQWLVGPPGGGRAYIREAVLAEKGSHFVHDGVNMLFRRFHYDKSQGRRVKIIRERREVCPYQLSVGSIYMNIRSFLLTLEVVPVARTFND